MQKIPEILFVCGANSCRSQMAEGLLRRQLGDKARVYSAGTSAGSVHPLAARVMQEAGQDISDQTSKSLSQLPDIGFDFVITLCDNARGVCFSPDLLDEDSRKRIFAGLPAFLHWGIDDPDAAEGTEAEILTAFRKARDEIQAHIDIFLQQGYLDALTVERNRLQRFVDMLDAGVMVHDCNRVIFLVNRAFLQITGWKREDLIGRDCHVVFGPNGLCGQQCDFCETPGHTSGRREYETSFLSGEGKTLQLKMTTEMVEIEPGRQGIMVLVRDDSLITDLKVQLHRRRSYHGIVGDSDVVQDLFKTIETVSSSDYPVLVVGESGSGKELVANAIHNESSRSNRPFVPVNCGALPESIVESELFGHVRGAFTGAIRDKKGRFELADGGTLFLDEVAELQPSIQVKLLRILQEKTFQRVGGEKPVKVDVRIISATHRNLQQMVSRGEFREDLYYRLCVVPIELPPLRHRREDIPYLVEHFLERIRQESGKPLSGVDARTLDLLMAHTWPGNIRELINALQFASVRTEGGLIMPEYLPPEVRYGINRLTDQGGGADDPRPQPGSFSGNRTGLTRETVLSAIASSGGNKAKAAKLLGVGRATLYRFMKQHID
jgi:sigma-54 dependent transcriptional regulator, acetoin dehydrogenase operon transcriptional activator AcoR